MKWVSWVYEEMLVLCVPLFSLDVSECGSKRGVSGLQLRYEIELDTLHDRFYILKFQTSVYSTQACRHQR